MAELVECIEHLMDSKSVPGFHTYKSASLVDCCWSSDSVWCELLWEFVMGVRRVTFHHYYVLHVLFSQLIYILTYTLQVVSRISLTRLHGLISITVADSYLY